MSSYQLGLAWAAPTTGNAKLVLLFLADQSDDEGTNAWPALDTIAAACGCTRRSAQRALRTLEAEGLIAVQAAAGELHPSTTYQLTVPDRGGVKVTPPQDKVTPDPDPISRDHPDRDHGTGSGVKTTPQGVTVSPRGTMLTALEAMLGTLTPGVATTVASWAEEGYTVPDVRWAIAEATARNARSFAYVRGIIQNNEPGFAARKGITDAATKRSPQPARHADRF